MGCGGMSEGVLEVMNCEFWPARVGRRGWGYTPSEGVLRHVELMDETSSRGTAAGRTGEESMSASLRGRREGVVDVGDLELVERSKERGDVRSFFVV